MTDEQMKIMFGERNEIPKTMVAKAAEAIAKETMRLLKDLVEMAMANGLVTSLADVTQFLRDNVRDTVAEVVASIMKEIAAAD